MKNITLSILLIFLLTTTIQAQPGQDWAMTYDAGRAEGFWDIYATEDGSYVMCGSSGNSWLGQGSPLIVKIDASGDVIWLEVYEDAGARLRSIIEADNNDLVACGKRNGRVTVMRTDEDGEIDWWRDYVDGEGRAIIELKDGNFLLAGESNRRCYLLMLNGEGNVIWQDQNVIEDGRGRLTCIRETDGGAVIGGWGRHNAFFNLTHPWLIKIELQDGDVTWERHYNPGGASNTCFALDSSPDGGFAFSGWARGMSLIKVENDGDQEWIRNYRGAAHESYGLVALDRGGYYLVGRIVVNGAPTQSLVRTQPNGNERWRRTFTWQDRGGFVRGRNEFYSVIVGHDNSIYAAGSQRVDSTGQDGIVVKLEPEIIGPVIAYHSPEDTLLSVLPGDTVQFIVRAVNQWGLEMDYEWLMDSVAVEDGNDTTITVIFEELGEYEVECRVSDDDWTSVIRWQIETTELYIDFYQPDSLQLPIRRGTNVDFSVSVRVLNELEIEYSWLLNDEEIGQEDSVNINFEQGREITVEAIASSGDLSDRVIWQVELQDFIVDWLPQQLELSVVVDTSFEFEVFPFDPEDDSLQFLWTLNGDSISDNSWAFVDFDSAGIYQLTAHVSDTTESDSLMWEVTVRPNAVDIHDISQIPTVPTLYAASPNPFNSQTTVRYYLPTASQIRLELFDINGRLVDELVNQYHIAGRYEVIASGSELVSGVYFVRMLTQDDAAVRKLVLMR